MKYSDITFKGIWRALRRQWKVLLLCIAVFAVIGVGAGFLYADSQSAPADGTAGSFPFVDFSEIVYDKDYYTACYQKLSSTHTNINTYLSALLSDSSISAAQKEQLRQMQQSLTEVLVPLKEAYGKMDAMYFPPEFRDMVIENYEKLLEGTRRSLIVSEAAVELLKEMQAPVITSDSITKSYEALLSQAANYGTYLRNIDTYQQTIDRLNNDYHLIRAESAQVSDELEKAAVALNDAIEDINVAARQIAAENFIHINLSYDSNGAILTTVTHTHDESSAQDVFAILVIFCVLVGVCCGAFFAICREVIVEKKKVAEQSNAQ